MKTRDVEKIIPPPPVHWVGDGFRVHNFIPGTGQVPRERVSPFILLDYNSKHYFAPSEKPRGVGVHPHRGFETVSIAYKGKIAHHGSFGNTCALVIEGSIILNGTKKAESDHFVLFTNDGLDSCRTD